MIILLVGTSSLGTSTTIYHEVEQCNVVVSKSEESETIEMNSAEIYNFYLKNRECIVVSPINMDIYTLDHKYNYAISVVKINYNCSIVVLRIIQLEDTYG